MKPEQILGIMFGALSLFALVKNALKIGMAAVFGAFIDTYEQWMHGLFRWAEAPLRSVLSSIGPILQLNLDLYPHWKHVFVLVFLYFNASIYVSTQDPDRTRRRRIVLSLTLISIAFVLALLSSITAGLFPLEGREELALDPILVVAPPIAAIILYQLSFRGVSLAVDGSYYYREPMWVTPLQLTSGSALLIGVGELLYRTGAISDGPTLAALLLVSMIVSLGCYWEWRGSSSGAPGYAAASPLGRRILYVCASTFGMLVTNAGMKLLG